MTLGSRAIRDQMVGPDRWDRRETLGLWDLRDSKATWDLEAKREVKGIMVYRVNQGCKAPKEPPGATVATGPKERTDFLVFREEMVFMVIRVHQACVGQRVILHKVHLHRASRVLQVHLATRGPWASTVCPDCLDYEGILDPRGRMGFTDFQGILVPRVRKVPAALQDAEGQRAREDPQALRGHRAVLVSFCKGVSCCRVE